MQESRGVFPPFQSPGSRRARHLVTNSRGPAGRVRQHEGGVRAHMPRLLSRYWSKKPGSYLEIQQSEREKRNTEKAG